MSWIFLLIAGLCEIVWAVSLKLSNGFSKLSYSILTVLFLIVSFVLLALALKNFQLELLIQFGLELVLRELF